MREREDRDNLSSLLFLFFLFSSSQWYEQSVKGIMPNIKLPLTSISESVSRPVYTDMVQQVQKLTKIDEKTKIFFPGEIRKMRTAGTHIDSNDERFAIFNSDRYTFIEVEDDFDMDSLGSTAMERDEHAPVFVDNKLGVTIKPVYVTTNVTINFTYRCPSKSEALRWRDEARIRISEMWDIHLHKFSYHYQLPLDIVILLKEIYDKREAVAGYGQSFQEYVTSFSSPRLTLIGGVTGEHEVLAIAETQTRVQGRFNWDSMPEKAQRDDSTGTWSVSFSYVFSFEKPLHIHARYPIIVHNQLLAPEFIEFTDKAYDVEKDVKTFSKSYFAMHAFEIGTIMATKVNKDYVMRVPSYDDYQLPSVNKGSGTVFLALTDVAEDKRTLVNLRELGDIMIDEDIMDFIVNSEYPYITKDFGSILRLSLYRNDSLTSDRTITCSPDLTIKASSDLDLRNQYRLRFSIYVDITLLDVRALQRLQKFPKALIKIIGSMNELLKNHPDFNDLGNKRFISNHDFSSITSFLTGYRIPIKNGNYFGPGIDNRNLFGDMDPVVVEQYRREAIGSNRVMNNGVLAYRKN
jgi:hypothetical protein